MNLFSRILRVLISFMAKQQVMSILSYSTTAIFLGCRLRQLRRFWMWQEKTAKFSLDALQPTCHSIRPESYATNSFGEGQETINCNGFICKQFDHHLAQEFMRIFAPALPAGAFAEDIMAILKCASIVLFANQKVFLRSPSEKHIPVQVIAYPHGEKNLLTQQCKDWKTTPRRVNNDTLHEQEKSHCTALV